MFRSFFSVILVICVCLPTFTNAKTLLRDDDDFELEPMFRDKTWDMSAELGVLITSGSTQSTSFLAKANAHHEWQSWRMKYSFNALYKKDDVYDEEQQKEIFKTSAEQYIFNIQADYELTETDAVFGFYSYTDDRFGAYVEYATIVAGYSFRAVNDDDMVLDLNLGPGYAKGLTFEGESEQGFILRGSAAFKWDFTDYARFIQNVSVETAGFNTRTISETSLNTRLTSSMQMKVGFKATHNTEVEGEQPKLSTETSLTLVVNI
ncbi:DUF481 domain-containing protein [Psychrosphaera haliotis]|nr:DUF481 domain-containing protein [Psychrosphaera haliotis]